MEGKGRGSLRNKRGEIGGEGKRREDRERGWKEGKGKEGTPKGCLTPPVFQILKNILTESHGRQSDWDRIDLT